MLGQNRQVLFSLSDPYKQVAEQCEAQPQNLTCTNWWSILKLARMFYGQRAEEKKPARPNYWTSKNCQRTWLKIYRLEPHFVKENFLVRGIMPDPIPGNVPKEEIIKNEGEVLLNQAEILCEEIDKQEYHSNLVARIIKELLRIYAKRGNYEKALQIADSQKEKSPLYQSDLLGELAVIKNSQGEDPSSLLLDAEAVIENYMSSVDINSYSNPNNFYKFLSEIYLGLAGNYLRCGKNPAIILEKMKALSEKVSGSSKEDINKDINMILTDSGEYVADLEQHYWERMKIHEFSDEELQEFGDPINFVESYSIRNNFSKASEYLREMERSGDPGTFATAKINFTCQIIRRASELLESN